MEKAMKWLYGEYCASTQLTRFTTGLTSGEAIKRIQQPVAVVMKTDKYYE